MRIYNLIILIGLLSVSFIHKDRVSLAKSIILVYDKPDTVRLKPSDELKLKMHSEELFVSKQLCHACIVFESNETLSIDRKNGKWISMKVSDGKNEAFVPDKTLAKITQINFETIGLLWNGENSQAFAASYFYITFEIDTQEYFGKRKELQLLFTKNTFKRATLTEQIAENSEQDSEF
jgi:hypothetical protein